MRLLPPEIRHFSSSNYTPDIFVDESAFSAILYYGGVSLTAIATAFTILANTLTIVVLIRHRHLHSSISNLYILNLSFADLLIGLIVMVVMAVHLFVYRLQWFFGPPWLCDAWQLSDIILSTTSLYSICAIALDRLWNLEKPLRIFKRSRRIAKQLIFVIWVLPAVTWAPIYFILTNRTCNHIICPLSEGQTSCCYTVWSRKFIVPIVAVPLLYIPSAILVAMFVRISFVVHRHLKFLREHSNKAVKSVGSQGIDGAPPSSSNSYCKSRDGAALRTRELSCKLTDNSAAIITSGYCTSLVRSPRSPSSRAVKLEWNLAALSEERSNGRERSQSEQIQLHAGQINHREEAAANHKHRQIHGAASMPTRNGSVQTKDLVMAQRIDLLFSNTPALEGPPPPFIKSAHSLTAAENGVESTSGIQRRFSRLSPLNRVGSCRFSVIAISANLTDLLHKESVSRQMRAAKAVALISGSFLVCWMPFLIVWPIKVFCNECIPEDLYVTSIWLNYLCSTINPLLYTLSSPRIRGVLRHYFRCTSLRSPLKGSIFRSATIV